MKEHTKDIVFGSIICLVGLSGIYSLLDFSLLGTIVDKIPERTFPETIFKPYNFYLDYEYTFLRMIYYGEGPIFLLTMVFLVPGIYRLSTLISPKTRLYLEKLLYQIFIPILLVFHLYLSWIGLPDIGSVIEKYSYPTNIEFIYSLDDKFFDWLIHGVFIGGLLIINTIYIIIYRKPLFNRYSIFNRLVHTWSFNKKK